MADYPISKEAVQKMLIDLRSSLGNERYISIGITMALHQLDGFPQMDAVPVVRCRNCRLWRRTEAHYGKCPFLIGENQYTSEDGFCNLADKMDAQDMDAPTKDGGAEG